MNPTAEPYRHDPVSSIAETEATGEIAAIFADIRSTMQIPLVTSIWRTLAGIEGGLRATWDAIKPIYETGQPAAALLKIRSPTTLPVPKTLRPGQLAQAGVSPEALPVIRALIGAYNRSNGINLIALSGLVTASTGLPANNPVPPPPTPWPSLPPLLSQSELAPQTWSLLLRVNRFGSNPDQSGLATLWRHLAHWPGLLSLIDEELAPLQENGTIQRSIQQILDLAKAEGPQLAHFRPGNNSLPSAALDMVTQYVRVPGLVTRMVAIGHGLAIWLKPDPS